MEQGEIILYQPGYHYSIHYSLLIINYHEKVRMEYYYQSDHRRSYRHRRGTWHPILYSLIFNYHG